MLTTALPAFAQQELRDGFYWLDRLNRASLVMMSEQEILTSEQVNNIAMSLDQLYEDAAAEGANRPSSYSGMEPALIAIGGPEVSRLHTGRSTWDTGAVRARMQQREMLLELYGNLIAARQEMLNFADAHADAIIPAYTGGVQAQPVSMGHFLTAYINTLGRHADAIEETFAALNQSPFGAAALGTSTYPLDRQLLSDLLGFDGVIYNSYDAVLLSTPEINTRIVGDLAGIAVTAGQLSEDLGNQYYLARPWLTFPVGEPGSTIMPQKQNPSGVNSTRSASTAALSEVISYLVEVHNAESGRFNDGGGGGGGQSVGDAAARINATLTSISNMFATFIFHEDRAMQVVLDDYATATELANSLQRFGGLPFGEAHHVAAELVNFGRANNLRASEITFEQFEEVFDEVAADHELHQEDSGLTEEQLKAALSPENMVTSALGLGGPQPSEVAIMIDTAGEVLAVDAAWLEETRARLEASSEALDEAFGAL